MAKAVVPMPAFRAKFGELGGDEIGPKLQGLAQEFLQHEAPAPEKKREAAIAKP